MLAALQNFPDVCRLCLRTESDVKMVSIPGTAVPEFGQQQLCSLLDDFGLAAPKDIATLLPSFICQRCLQEFIAAYKMKRRFEFLLSFEVAYARLKFESNADSLRQLYDNNYGYLEMIFYELGILRWDQSLEWDDLVEQKPAIASSKEEISFEMTIDKTTLVDDIKIEFVEMEVNDFQVDAANVEQSQRNNNENEVQTIAPNQVLSCGICDFTTISEEAFEYHLQDHPVNTKFCDIDNCGKQFEQRKGLLGHKKIVHSRYLCKHCFATVKDEHSLKVHSKWHEGETDFPCFYCPMKFSTKDEYRLHLDTIHGADECHTCETCGLQFKDLSALRSHLRSHADVRNYKCPDCDKSFKFRKDVSRHKKAVHVNERFTCKYCSKTYVRNDKLRQHIERNHDLQTYFLCDICIKSFPTKEQLQEHKSQHENPKPNQCTTCMVTYPGQTELKAHQCITYRDDYVCCERDFKFHTHYNRHMFLAHGEKTNVRVKPDAMLKYKSRCSKCKLVFETAMLKRTHERSCKKRGKYTKREKVPKEVVTSFPCK